LENNGGKIAMYGGALGGFAPLLILVSLLIWISLAGAGGTFAFWAAGWIALTAGLFLAKNKSDYCSALIHGLSDKNGIVIITAWIFAGVFGKLMVMGGMVQGLLWFGIKTGTHGALFTVMSFIVAMVFSTGTGTGTGTVISMAPILYPAGVYLGANPVMLALALLSGAAFGDNLSPISDTTIVSAYTQEATMRDVVKTRFPLAVTAALFTIVVLLLAGGGGDVKSLPELKAELSPAGLVMLLGFAAVIISSLAGRHIIESLIYGNVAAAGIGVISGQVKISDIFHIPHQRGESTGLIQDGISAVVGAIVIALLILAVARIFQESGGMAKILAFIKKTFAKTVIQAELTIIFITILFSALISSNAPTELLVGPNLVKPLGKKFNLSPARRANLMDCSVCSIFYTIPWAIIVVVWYGALDAAAKAFNIQAPPIYSAFLNPYSWALFIVIVFSAITGWNRKFETPDNNEAVEHL
jgi:Na+/H+ antiporter NhaC